MKIENQQINGGNQLFMGKVNKDYLKIATVLYCHQFIAKDHDQPGMAAGMVFSQLAGYSLSEIIKVAKQESLNMEGHELNKYFK